MRRAFITWVALFGALLSTYSFQTPASFSRISNLPQFPLRRLTPIQSSYAVMPPADLTPAVDKYDRLPTGPRTDVYFMTAKGPSPPGPDPFNLVAAELQPLSDYVKELVVSENPVLTMAATHFFDQVNILLRVMMRRKATTFRGCIIVTKAQLTCILNASLTHLLLPLPPF